MYISFLEATISIETIKTVIANGGGNINMNGKLVELKHGYMVSIDGHEKRVAVPADLDVLHAQFNNYLNRVQHYNIGADIVGYFGVWAESGSLVFDISVQVTHGYGSESALETAYTLAHEHRQRAIYDVAARTVLPVI